MSEDQEHIEYPTPEKPRVPTQPLPALPDLPPPPPRRKYRWVKSVLVIFGVLCLLGVVVAVGVVAYLERTFTASHETHTGVIDQTETTIPTVSPTSVSPTAMPTLAPTPTPVAPYTGPTADGLLAYFIQDHRLTIAGSADGQGLYPIDHSVWLSCCPFYPAHGSYQFEDDTSGYSITIRIGVFNTTVDAATAARYTLNSWQWKYGTYFVEGQCLLVAEQAFNNNTHYTILR